MELRQIQCPNCGSSVSQMNPSSQSVVCSSCQALLSLRHLAPEILSQTSKLSKAPKPIKLGARATLNGIPCVVLGRVKYVGWTPGESSDRWHWDEWLLGADDGRMFWLSYDDEAGFVIYHKMRIKHPFDPFRSSSIPVTATHGARVKERYPAQIVGAEGELTWQPKTQDRLQVIEGFSNGRHYSVQMDRNELELYEGVPVDESTIAMAFADKKWARRAKERQEIQFVLAFAGIASLVFALIGLVLGVAMGLTGEEVLSQNVRLDAANPSVTFPLNLDNTRPLSVSMDLQNTLPANSWAELDVSIIDPSGEEVDLFSKEYWHETGVDDEGSWEEQDYDNSGKFVPAEAGQYQLKLALGERDTSVSGAMNVDVKVEKNKFVTTWFYGYGGVMGVLGLALLGASAPKKAGNLLSAIAENLGDD